MSPSEPLEMNPIEDHKMTHAHGNTRTTQALVTIGEVEKTMSYVGPKQKCKMLIPLEKAPTLGGDFGPMVRLAHRSRANKGGPIELFQSLPGLFLAFANFVPIFSAGSCDYG